MQPLDLTPDDVTNLIDRLTPRQLQVIELLAQGKSDKEAGYLLSISVRTIQGHVYRACRSIDAENRIQLIVIFAMAKSKK